MLSKGGKVFWLCPHCRSQEIALVKHDEVYAALARPASGGFSEKEYDEGIDMTWEHGECWDCQRWFPWRQRIKVSVSNHPEN